MSNNAEFSISDIVHYQKTGTTKVYKAQVNGLSQNPITKEVEYKLFYRIMPGSSYRVITTGKNILESIHFAGKKKL
jgi:hypothetical protein